MNDTSIFDVQSIHHLTVDNCRRFFPHVKVNDSDDIMLIATKNDRSYLCINYKPIPSTMSLLDAERCGGVSIQQFLGEDTLKSDIIKQLDLVVKEIKLKRSLDADSFYEAVNKEFLRKKEESGRRMLQVSNRKVAIHHDLEMSGNMAKGELERDYGIYKIMQDTTL